MIVLMLAGTWAEEFSDPRPKMKEFRPRIVETMTIKTDLDFIGVLLSCGFRPSPYNAGNPGNDS
jgi:hypothetical protein